MICLKDGFFRKYLLFEKYNIFRAFQVRVPKASVLFQSKSRNVLPVFPRGVSAANMLRLGTFIRKEGKNDVKVVVESFDINKKEWKTVERGYC